MLLLVSALFLSQGLLGFSSNTADTSGKWLHITEVLLKENPKRVLLPRGLQKIAKQSQVVGTQKDFYIRDLAKSESWEARPYELILNSEFCRIWIDVIDFSYVTERQTITSLREQLDIYLNQSTSIYSNSPEKGILSIVKETFGEIPDPDSDNKIDILLLNILEPKGVSGFVAGYFDPIDLSDHPKSNRADILYIDIYPLIYIGPNSDSVSVKQAAGTISHELQHLILQGYKGNNQEETFINEGLSELSEILCGFDPRPGDSFFSSTSRPFFSWNYSNALPDYSRASLWFHYVYEQIGKNWLKSFIQDSRTGLPHYFSVMKQQGVSFSEMWKTWFVALLNQGKKVSVSPYKDERRKQIGGINPTELNSGFYTQTNGEYQFRFQTAKNVIELELESSIDFQLNYYLENEGFSEKKEFERIGKHEKFKLDNLDYVEWVQFWEENPDTSKIISSTYLSKSKTELITHAGNGKLTAFSFYSTFLTLENELKKIALVFPVQQFQTITEVGFAGLFENEFQHSSVGVDIPRVYNLRVYPIKNGIIQFEPIEEWENRVSRRGFGNAAMEWIPFTESFNPQSKGISELFIEVSSASDQNKFTMGMQGNGTSSAWFTPANWNPELIQNKSLYTLSFYGYPLDKSSIPLISLKHETEVPQFPFQIEASRDGKQIQLSINSSIRSQLHVNQFVLKNPKREMELLSFLDEYNEKLEPFELVDEGHYEAIVSYTYQNYNYVARQDWIFPKSKSFALNNLFPNPFNPSTTIELTLLSRANEIRLNVFDVLGRNVKQEFYPAMEAGIHQLPVSLNGLSSGLYFFRFELTDDAQRTEILISKGILAK